MQVNILPSDKYSLLLLADWLEEYGSSYDIVKSTAIRNFKYNLNTYAKGIELESSGMGSGWGSGRGTGWACGASISGSGLGNGYGLGCGSIYLSYNVGGKK